jgi:hypothetical protein
MTSLRCNVTKSTALYSEGPVFKTDPTPAILTDGRRFLSSSGYLFELCQTASFHILSNLLFIIFFDADALEVSDV